MHVCKNIRKKAYIAAWMFVNAMRGFDIEPLLKLPWSQDSYLHLSYDDPSSTFLLLSRER